MKEVLVGTLEVGDVFIDGDMISTLWARGGLVASDGVLQAIAKLIVGPTAPSREMYINRYYYIPNDATVLLCEKEL